MQGRETPQTETTPLHPRSRTRARRLFVLQTVNIAELRSTVQRILFNHEAPVGETFVTRKITRAATRIRSPRTSVPRQSGSKRDGLRRDTSRRCG